VIVEFKYAGQSAIVSGLRDTHVGLATNSVRDPAFFRGTMRSPTLFREAMASLYSVVVSDYKFHPRDRLAFKAWLDEQDRKFLDNLGDRTEHAKVRIALLESRRAVLDQKRIDRLKPFYRARADFFEWVYTHQYELNYLLDPVITVHPDELSFEAFSRDESSYARIGVKYDLFEKIDEFACGTTNIDFSSTLHGELDRMRSYRRTRFDIDPTGLAMAAEGGSSHKEKKIDLPESWVKGFLQVQSTMTLGLTRLRIEPVDLYNLCRFLKRHKARTSPRAMRWELVPGKRARVVFEPWETSIEMGASAVFDGPKPLTIRTWGRDRLSTLARIIPAAQRIDVFLAGTGLPTIWLVDLGEVTFTLALSGWTDNDWTSGAGRFDLLSRRMDASPLELTATWDALKAQRRGTESGLSLATGLGVEKTRSALSYLCQVGRAMYDLGGGVYRQRELFPEPFTVKEAIAAVVAPAPSEASPAGQKAQTIFASNGVLITARRPVSNGYKLSGSVKGVDGYRYRPMLGVDASGRILEATCTCAWSQKHGLTQGPCEHVLALRLGHMHRLEAEGA
jgi:hypothetical protein